MCTKGTDCEHLTSSARQKNLLIADMADEHCAVGERVESDTLGKVRTAELRFFLRHRGSLCDLNAALIWPQRVGVNQSC